MNSLKYIIPFLFFSSFIVDCNQTEGSDKDNGYKVPEKPIVQSKIDSVKYKAEIYRLDTLFTKLYKANVFNGNVLIAKGKDIIYQKSFGYGIKESNKLLNDSSIFQLASVSKVITGVATLLLYEQGKLNLDSKVSDILADFPYKNVTVKHVAKFGDIDIIGNKESLTYPACTGWFYYIYAPHKRNNNLLN